VIRLLVALVTLSPVVTAAAADQMASIRIGLERCRAEQAAQPARIGPVKEGGFFKQQELNARYRLETPTTTSPNQATTAFVEVATTIARATAPSEEAVLAMALSIESSVAGLERLYVFEWKGGHWLLTDAFIRPILKMPPGLTATTAGSQKIAPSAARTGSDAGAACVQTIEAL